MSHNSRSTCSLGGMIVKS